MRRIMALILPLLVVLPQQAAAQAGQATGTVTGQVTGEGEAPLAGVIVRVNGTSLATLTDNNGRYTLPDVPAGNQSITASSIGYSESQRAVTVAAGQTVTLNIALESDVLALEGIVAVGYGTQRRQDVTGSVASVRMESVENRVIQGATEALTGMLPGVRVVSSTGLPGSGAEVQIRGVSAIGAGATPLYVVDGFPITADNASGGRSFVTRNPLTDIPPSEIESITVLKDASSAAIYGSQASNGVVIITTRRGQASDRPQIDINVRSGISSPMYDRLPAVANATEFATFMNRRDRQLLWVADGRTGPFPGSNDPRIDERWRDPASYGEGTSWFRAIMDNEPTHEVNASVSGGTEQVRIHLSSGYLEQTGVVLNSKYRRANVRANLDANVGDRMSVQLSIAPTYSIRDILNEGGAARSGALGSTTNAWPTDTPYNPDGSVKSHIWGSTRGPTLRNPLDVIRQEEAKTYALNTLFSGAVTIQLVDGVSLRSAANLRRSNSKNWDYSPTSLLNTNGDPQDASIDVGLGESTSWLQENTLTINRQFGLHSLQLLGGTSIQKSISESFSIDKNDLPDDIIKTINDPTGGGTGWNSWSMASVFGRINVNLADKYILTATVRRDGSSRFGPSNRWGTFPSAAFAWNFGQEGFMEGIEWITDARFRASLGFTGNNQIGNFSHFGNVSNSTTMFGSSPVNGRGINNLSNPTLGWERTREVNLGLEFSMFNNRVDFTVEGYRRVTQDLLFPRQLPTASGFSSVTSNVGSVQNQGLELGVTTTNVARPGFSWTTTANVSFNRTKALDLGESDTLYSGASMEGANTHITIVGQPIAQFYGYRIIGIYTEEDINNPNVAKYDGAVSTDVRYADINGDGVIRQMEDFDIIGSPWPKFTWGMTNNVNVGNFRISATMDGQVGGQTINRNLATIENIDGPFNVSKAYVQDMFVDWDSIGSGFAPAAGSSSTGGRRSFRDITDRWLQDAGFLWVRNLQVNYRLPATLASRILNARNASLYVSLENPLIITECQCNPQTAPNQNLAAGGAPNSPSLTPGVDNFSYPLSRMYTLGIQLGL